MISVKVGGKLYWGGEYAVVEAGHTAVVMAVNRYLEAKLDFSTGLGNIHSTLYHHHLLWSYKNGKLHIDHHDDYSLIIKTVELMSEYLSERAIPLRVFDLEIDSDLHDSAFQKYGFGSSGAVVVAVVRGILRLYGQQDEDWLVFKLACLILLKIGNNGSMGDVASCTYGGLIAYTSFDRRQIMAWLEEKPIGEIVAAEWRGLMIRRLENYLLAEAVIGWTGKEAISSQLVYEVGLAKDKIEYAEFLQHSQIWVERLIQAVEAGEKEDFKQAIRQLRRGLSQLGAMCRIPIETEELKALAELAERYDAVGKLSGAGGGDCGIIFLFDPQQKQALLKDMAEQGIYRLSFAE